MKEQLALLYAFLSRCNPYVKNSKLVIRNSSNHSVDFIAGINLSCPLIGEDNQSNLFISVKLNLRSNAWFTSLVFIPAANCLFPD
jgi:hypothetical protein